MNNTEQKLVEAVYEMVKDAVEETLGEKFNEFADGWWQEQDLADLEIDTDNIVGLEDWLENQMTGSKGWLEARNIDGLEEYINDWDFTQDNRIMDAVRCEAEDFLRNQLGDYLQESTINACQLEDMENAMSMAFQQSRALQLLVREYAQDQINQRQQQLLQKLSPLYWLRRAGSALKGFCLKGFFLRLYSNLISWRRK